MSSLLVNGSQHWKCPSVSTKTSFNYSCKTFYKWIFSNKARTLGTWSVLSSTVIPASTFWAVWTLWNDNVQLSHQSHTSCLTGETLRFPSRLRSPPLASPPPSDTRSCTSSSQQSVKVLTPADGTTAIGEKNHLLTWSSHTDQDTPQSLCISNINLLGDFNINHFIFCVQFLSHFPKCWWIDQIKNVPNALKIFFIMSWKIPAAVSDS